MLLTCERCKKKTLHRSIEDRIGDNEPFKYRACYDCGDIYLPLFGYKERDKKNETKKSV